MWLKNLKPLIGDKDGDNYTISLGRILLIISSIPALIIWWIGKHDIQPNYMMFLISLMGYELSKKGVGLAQSIWGSPQAPMFPPTTNNDENLRGNPNQ